MASKFGGVPIPEDRPRSKFGGIPLTDQVTHRGPAEIQTQAPQTFGHAASNFMDAINPLPGIGQAVSHPLETGKRLIKAQGNEFKQVPQLVRQGRYTEAFGHGLAGALPLVGPAAAEVGNQIGGSPAETDQFGNITTPERPPDIAGGMGKGAGLIGAVAGAPAVTRGVGKAIAAPSEPLVRTALRLPSKAQSFGATPARAVLEDTSGVRPSTIARTGQETMNRLRPEMESKVAAATQPVPLSEPRASVVDAQDLASRQGNKAVYEQIQPMREALDKNRVTGTPYPADLTPMQALNLKRGFGDEFTSYNPNLHTSVNALAKDIYGQLRRGIHASAPGSEQLDQRIQSLIPAVHSAENVSRSPGVGQRVLGRISRPTGGLLPMVIGYHEGGPLGAAAGIVGSEAAASPVPLMTAARALHGTGKVLQSPPAGRIAQAAPFVRKKENQ